MTYSYRKKDTKQTKKIFQIIALLLFSLVIVGILVQMTTKHTDIESTEDTGNNQKQTTQLIEDSYTSIDLQPELNTWLDKQIADYSIAIYDLENGKLIGSNKKDESIFAASLYKIYIAYISYSDFQNNKQNPDEIILPGQTKLECVDKMIRSSDSPCGEAMMADIGQENLNNRVEELGMINTRFDGISTTAEDTGKLLQLINSKIHLNDEYTALLLDSMQHQDFKYKRGLEKGAPEATWYTKVGWNEDINYHDIGIMELADKRRFAVSILGRGSGSPIPIADFSALIYNLLITQNN